MRYRKLGLLLGLAAIAVVVVGTASAAGSKSSSIPVISDSQLKAEFTTVGGLTGGAAPEPAGVRTIPHWFGTTLDPSNGVTYGYNMVGADPSTCPGTGCDVTVQADITPINVVVQYGGQDWTFNGADVLGATLASPQFADNYYGTTPAATVASCGPNTAECGGAGGTLSQGDAGNQLQLEDATMRAQFNQTGSSNYHVRLNPNVMPTVTIVVPQKHATLLQSGRGVVFADVDINWWATQIKNLETKADPTHLPIYLTNDVMNYIGAPHNCCVIGFHGTIPVGLGYGSGNSKGQAKLQTFAWASYVAPGLYARANGGTYWALQDIHALSHEVSEWADDPFVNNFVEPWVTPTAPQYGCTGILETGDPVVAIGFAMGKNKYEQGPNPDGSQSADGYYHPEDEVFLPWFMRTAPNTVSEPTQTASANVGRYTFMGDLNPFPGFRQPATGC
ncbi:MAG TPA: hypothetical protein VE088_00980 [Gaiellaceae bacterium]|nr:hypothetical protein [Gaiellaceae bacterium]